MRRDIQALRGFSILVVLLYHAQFGWLRGGFLGVDIFFVISGFVITSKLMEGEGTFGKQIKEFYIRRAKRIFPASLTVTLLTSIFAILFLPAISRSRFSLEALSSALFIIFVKIVYFFVSYHIIYLFRLLFRLTIMVCQLISNQ